MLYKILSHCTKSLLIDEKKLVDLPYLAVYFYGLWSIMYENCTPNLITEEDILDDPDSEFDNIEYVSENVSSSRTSRCTQKS